MLCSNERVGWESGEFGGEGSFGEEGGQLVGGLLLDGEVDWLGLRVCEEDGRDLFGGEASSSKRAGLLCELRPSGLNEVREF